MGFRSHRKLLPRLEALDGQSPHTRFNEGLIDSAHGEIASTVPPRTLQGRSRRWAQGMSADSASPRPLSRQAAPPFARALPMPLKLAPSTSPTAPIFRCPSIPSALPGQASRIPSHLHPPLPPHSNRRCATLPIIALCVHHSLPSPQASALISESPYSWPANPPASARLHPALSQPHRPPPAPFAFWSTTTTAVATSSAASWQTSSSPSATSSRA